MKTLFSTIILVAFMLLPMGTKATQNPPDSFGCTREGCTLELVTSCAGWVMTITCEDDIPYTWSGPGYWQGSICGNVVISDPGC